MSIRARKKLKAGTSVGTWKRRVRFAWFAMATFLVIGQTCTGAHIKKNDLAKTFRYDLENPNDTYPVGESINLKATLSNRTSKRIAVDPASMSKHVIYKKLPEEPDQFSSVGTVTGDPYPIGPASAMTILQPEEVVSTVIQLHLVLEDVLAVPGMYRVSLEYCYFGPSMVDNVRAPVGCVSSNDVLIHVVAAN